jgi:competence protein ComEA
MALRDRLASLSRGELVGLVVVLAITLGGAGLWYARSLPKPVEIGAPASVGTGAPVSAATSPSGAPLIVDVAGEVRKPGVYEFAEGQRVIDAVNEAGGPTPKADLSSLNLAAPLTDGTQVLVPSSAGAAGVSGVPGTTTGTGLINVNTASASELETLSGIGEVLAAEIVNYRTEHGPFASVDDLDEVSGIGPATLEDIRDQVTV